MSARALTAALAAMLVFAPTKAGAFDWLWSDSATAASGCGSAFEGALSDGTDCFFDSGLNLMLRRGIDSANQVGKKVIGENFQFFGDFSYQGDAGFANDLDMVIPLAFTDPKSGASLFWQQGITRWRDSLGDSRDDLRFGVAYRFRLTGKPDSDIVGVSAFSLHNPERGHQVLASRVDYAGRWGTGSLTHFLPVTDWRSVDFAHEERALEGVELGLNLDVTTTIRANLTASAREAEDGSNEWEREARLGGDWRPHPWLSFNAGYGGIGGGEGSSSFLAQVSIPIGGPSRRAPGWEGLGAPPEGNSPGVYKLWRPVDKIGRIKVARRIKPSLLPELVQIRLEQNRVISGESLKVKLSLPVKATADVRMRVRLAPGSGPNPVVPGEDFHDKIIEATIRRGETHALISIPFIRNDNMRSPRSFRIVKVSGSSSRTTANN